MVLQESIVQVLAGDEWSHYFEEKYEYFFKQGLWCLIYNWKIIFF
jgi:hypothetical protein